MTDATKQNIADAVIRSLGSKPLNKLTIGEISKTAGVNRQTFYYHFDDIESLFAYMVDKKVASMEKEAPFGQNFQAEITKLLKVATDENFIIIHAYRSFETRVVDNLISHLLYDEVKAFVLSGSVGLDVGKSDLENCIKLWVLSLKGLFLYYLSTYQKTSLNEFALWMSILLKGVSRKSVINAANSHH